MTSRNFYVTSLFGLIVMVLASYVPQAAAQPSEQDPGTRIMIDLGALARPYATPAKAAPSKRIDRPTRSSIRVPKGFAATLFAVGLTNARNMKVMANGDVLVAESSEGKITLLRDADGDGKAETVGMFASGFTRPFGLDVFDGALYIGDQAGVWRVPYVPGDMKAQAKAKRITPDGAFGKPGGHWTRNLAVSPDGTKIYVAIGSAGNIEVEDDPRATVQVFNIDGSGQRTFARGLRNPVGLGFYPGTSDLYTVVNERDGLGDELVPDYLTKVRADGFYGWPYSYMGPNPQPGFADKRPDLVAAAIVPDVPFRSHSAPLGMTFYTADKFPAEYNSGAFVALHGSWNAKKPRAYNVVYVPFENGEPTGGYIVFASGFWLGGDDRAEVWGRPADVEVAHDGSLLIADDVSSSIWRVVYTGK